MTQIHSTAIVDPKAKIADSVSVGPFCVIGPDVTIGSGTIIEPHVVLKGPTTIGKDNHIFSFACIGEAPQDKKFAGEKTSLEIGDRNTIRESCTINRGTTQDAHVTRIGNDNWIMAYVHIAHDCQVGDNVILANNATLAGHVHVGDWAIFGGFAGAHQFCHIGAHSFLSMYAAVGKDVPAYVMVTGSPAEPRGVNSEGLKRRGFTRAQIANIRGAYKTLYRNKLRLEDAVTELQSRLADQPELQPLVDSIVQSERSIVR